MSIAYTLIRSKRRTLALTIDPAGALTVRAPNRLPLREIEAFLTQKLAWIQEKQAFARQRASQKPAFSLEEGMMLPFGDGGLMLATAKVPFAFGFHGFLLLPGHLDRALALKAWLQTQAQEALPARVSAQAQRMGLTPAQLCFSAARTRWGSMNTVGVLRLNVALMLCPSAVADYVIVHELAHIRHPNHSAAFWALVAHWMPDFKERRAWLRQNSRLIGLLHP